MPKPFADIPNKIDGSFAALDDVPFADDDDPLSGWVYDDDENGIRPFVFGRDPTPDERNATWAEQRIAEFADSEDGQPFFLAVGFTKPHTPMHVGLKYFDRFPLHDLELPVIKDGDVEDTHMREVFTPNQHGHRYYRLLGESYATIDDGLRAFVRAYLACVASADECVGRVFDALDATPLKENTIVVVVSDHGWQMGQKDYVFKSSPYEESTRIPFMIRAPGVSQPNTEVEQPISLIDLYPTLIDLCGLEGDTRKNDKGHPLDGHSTRSLLENPEQGEWDGPDAALSMIWNWGKGADRTDPSRMHWTIRSERWRYILWHNGSEELYDHSKDPYEWANLADKIEYQQIRESMSRKMNIMRLGE